MGTGQVAHKADGDRFPEEDRNQSIAALRRLRGADLTRPVDVYMDGYENEPITLPSVVMELLAEVLAKVAADQPVSIVTPETVFTTQQAADMLNVSRPYVIKLIDQGELPADKVGRHRRIKAGHLEEYRRRQRAASREAAREMTRLAASWGDDD